MQRPTYNNPPPAHSPPLHHPVPQHVSTVPQLRSPPPPIPQQSQSSQGGGYGYAPQQSQPQGAGGSYMHPAFGNFMNDSTAQMGFQVGQSAVKAGQEYVEQNFNRWIPVTALKHYFNVSNSYVLNKLLIVLFPWRHRPWSRKQQLNHNGTESYYLPPREDINSPDAYIPVMAFTTYILLSTLLAGIRGRFQPDLLASSLTSSFLIILLEIGSLKLGCYLLSIPSSTSSDGGAQSTSGFLDLISYSGYKFVGIIFTLVVSSILNTVLNPTASAGGGWVGWTLFLYTFLANAFFLLRSLKYVLLPDQNPGVQGAGVGGPVGAGGSYTMARAQRNRRTQFLFVYAYVVQFFFMWILSRQDIPQLPKAATGKA